MCGIAGILRVHPPGTPPPPPELAIPESWLDILDESIKHRGPDGQGRFRDRAVRSDGSVVDVAFVHRRLSILDHAGGAQPMVSIRGRSALRADSSLRTSHGISVLRTDSSPSHPTPNTAHSEVGNPTVGSESRPTRIFHGKPNDEVRYRPLDAATTAGLVAVVFNGCIYNHRELRKELQAAGHVFESDHSDTEVLVHGWREWGQSLWAKLDGMFASILWDRSTGQLLVTRDRFGEKPLYFRHRREVPYTLVVSSTCPGLDALPIGLDAVAKGSIAQAGLRRTLRSWVRFGYCNIPPLRTTGAILPGNLCVADSEKPPLESRAITWVAGNSWWRRWAPPPTPRTWHPPADRIDQLLRDAVYERLEADVPVGCFLSGGIDSSLITLHAHRHHPDVCTFTVRMPDPRLDESEAAIKIAKLIGVRHEILDCDPHPAQDLVLLIQQLGLPFGDSSLLPTYWVCKSASRVVKVALSGDGGDELFGGYRRYTAAHLLGHLGIFRHALRLVPGLTRPDSEPNTPRSMRARMVSAAIHDGCNDLLSIFPEPEITQLGFQNPWPRRSRAFFAAVQLVADIVSPPTEWFTRWRVASALGRDLATYLPEDILRKTDTASMSAPLEVRSPFLDQELSIAARQTRVGHLMPHNQRKGLLRAVARKYFPPEIVDRPKQGFAIPIGEWFRSDYGGMKQLLLDHLNSAEPWGSPALGIDLNMKFVRQMLDEHMGTGASGRVTRDHSQRLYMLLVLSIWAKWLSGLK